MESNDELRAELEAAIAKVSRQIEVEEGSRNFVAVGPSSTPALIEGLRAELSELQAALAGLAPAEPGGAESAASQPEQVPTPETPPTYGGGVLMALRNSRSGQGRRFDPAAMGVSLQILGALGALLTAVLALAHFLFGARFYEGRQPRRLMTDQEILVAFAIMIGVSCLIVGLGASVRRLVRPDDASTDLVI